MVAKHRLSFILFLLYMYGLLNYRERERERDRQCSNVREDRTVDVKVTTSCAGLLVVRGGCAVVHADVIQRHVANSQIAVYVSTTKHWSSVAAVRGALCAITPSHSYS